MSNENAFKAGPVHTNLNSSETINLFALFVWTGPLNTSGERFQNNAVSVSGFPASPVWTEDLA